MDGHNDMCGALAPIGRRPIEPAAAARLSRIGSWRRFPPGRRLFEAGDDACFLFGLIDGSVDLFAPCRDGDMRLMHRIHAPGWIGAGAVLADRPHHVSARVSASARCFVVGASRLRALVEGEPSLRSGFIELMETETALWRDLAGDALTPNSEIRVLGRLLALSSSGGSVRISQSELAEVAGVTRATVSRVLRRLADAGLVETGYGRVTLKHDPCGVEGRDISQIDRPRVAAVGGRTQ